MIIANGTLEKAIKTAGGISADGYATDSVVTWDTPIPCQFYAQNQNNLGRTNGEHFKAASYVIYIDMQPFATEQIRIKDSSGAIVGVFSVVSVSPLDAVDQLQILV